MHLTSVIQVYAGSPKLQENGFKAFIKSLGEVNWSGRIERIGCSRDPFPKRYFDSFTADDRNYLLKLSLKIEDCNIWSYILQNVADDITEDTYDRIAKKREFDDDNWTKLETKFETIKNERYKAEIKKVNAETEKLENLFAEYMLKNHGNKVVKRMLEEMTNEHTKKKTA
jgi:plasmid maintenance system antidote protein VapI